MNKIELKFAIPILILFVLLLIGFVSIPQQIIIKEMVLLSGLLFSILFTFLVFIVVKEKFNTLIKLSVGILSSCIGYLVFFSSVSLLTFYMPGEEIIYETNISNPIQRKTIKSSLPCLYNGSFQTKNNQDWFTVCIDENQFKDIKSNKKTTVMVTTKENIFGYTLISTKILS